MLRSNDRAQFPAAIAPKMAGTGTAMLPHWDLLSNDLQMVLAREAMRRASDTVAEQAETLAHEIDIGTLADRGGADALRLLAAVVRLAGQDPLIPAGNC